jgi:hypothetical protein
MGIDLVRATLWTAGAYVAIGVLVGVPFIVLGVGRVDRAARAAPWTFRMLVLPGVIALWPWILRRWWMSRGTS